MTHQGIKSHPLLKDYDCSETNDNTVALNHGCTFPPNRPYINIPPHFPCCGDKSIDYPQQPYETIPSTQASKGCHFNNQPQIASPFLVFQPGDFCEIYNSHILYEKFGKDSQRFTCYVEKTGCIIHFPKVPSDGDVYRSQRLDNALLLDLISTESLRDHHSLSTVGSPMYRNLYCVEKHGGLTSLRRMGEEIFSFHEENRTATYYLPDKDITLHFTTVPRDGDIFYSLPNNNVLILDILSTGSSLEHHYIHPRDRDLYQVHERNGGFLLMKMDNNNMHYEESYFFGGATQDEDYTFTCYLPDKDMAFHFNRVPTDGDIFYSQRKNNIMILDFPPVEELHTLSPYGSPWDADVYRVQQSNDGFELVMVTYSSLGMTATDEVQRALTIRRYIASKPFLDKRDNICAICLVAYKDFDRIGSMQGWGQEYHVNCITQLLVSKCYCPSSNRCIFNGCDVKNF